MTEPRAPKKDQALEVLAERGIPVHTVLDVGVCHGTPELIQAYPNVRHELFEPVTEFSDPIERIYAKVDHALHLVAVGDSNGEVSLRVRGVLEGLAISHSSMEDGADTAQADVRSVRKVRLDDYIQEKGIKGPFLLKIDIDGHEMQVLRGAERVLEDCTIVIVECSTTTLPDRIGFMQDHGFRVFDMCEPCYYDKCFWQCDVVFVSRAVYSEYFINLETTHFKKEHYEKFL